MHIKHTLVGCRSIIHYKGFFMNDKRILLVEDDAPLVHSLTFTLKRHNYGVLATRSAKQALEFVINAHCIGKPYDLLISDIQLPDMTGKELVDVLVANNVLPPTLIMTAFGTKELFADLKAKGVRECLDKPFDIYEFVSHVSQLLPHNKE